MNKATRSKLRIAFQLSPTGVPYFSVGTTMPRRIMFWQKMKMRSVGIAATTIEAKMTLWDDLCWS